MADAKEKRVYLTFEDYDIEDLLLYAGIDGIVTLDIAKKLLDTKVGDPVPYKWVTKQDGRLVVEQGSVRPIIDVYEEFTQPSLEFIIDLEITGFKYDVEKNRQVKARMEAELKQLEEVIFEGIGRPINLDSSQELAGYLYDECKFEIKTRTKSGEPSTEGDAVKALAKDHPDISWLPPLAKRNDIAAIYRTFVATYVEDFVKPDGRIHPVYNLHGTGSFRISGENPNLTQLPNPKHGYNIREFYGVDDGCLLIAADYSSAEVKILGALCKDPKLLQAIEEGKDFHAYSASEMYGVSYEEMVEVLEDEKHPKYKTYKQMRKNSKALTFGILYGSSPRGIAINLEISEAQALELISLYFDNFPKIREYVEVTHEMVRLNKFVVSPFHQRKMTFGGHQVFKGTAVYNAAMRLGQNVRVQNAASSFGLYCFSQLHEAIKPLDGKGLCTVYDSYEFQIPTEYAAQAVDLTYLHLEDLPVEHFDWLDLPVTIDVEVGHNWGHMKKVKRGSTQEQIMALVAELEDET